MEVLASAPVTLPEGLGDELERDSQAIAERMAVLSVEDYGERLLAAVRGVGGLP